MKIHSISDTKEYIPGGLAKGMPDSAFDQADLEEGIKIEMEHTTSRAVAKEIAKDHLKEDPKYYNKIKAIEGGKPIKESPDSIPDLDISWYDRDSVSFTLIDNYFMYDESDSVSQNRPTHEYFALYLVCMCDKQKYKELFEQISDRIGNVKHNLPPNWCSTNLANQIAKLYDKQSHVGRGSFIDHFSDHITQGRLWKNRKVVSFWDYPKYIVKKTKPIIDFISKFGDPSKFRYEIYDDLYSYKDFVAGNFKPDGTFDPSMLHTLAPGQKKQQLLNMGAEPKMRQMKAYRTFGDSLSKILDKVIR